MLKIYHQASLRKAQKRRLWATFAAGIAVGTILFLGSRDLEVISPAYAAETLGPTTALAPPAQRHPPLSLTLSHHLSSPSP